MIKDGTLGSMLQGVSQQPPAVRPFGMVTEQVNFSSDVVEGMTVRPAATERAVVEGSTVQDFKFLDAEIEGQRYIIGYRAGTMTIWDTDGVEQSLVVQNSALSYIGGELRPYVFEDKLYIANRGVVVQESSVVDTSGIHTNTAVITILGGLFSRTYSVAVRFSDGTVAEGTYTTPNGETAGDADDTASSTIASELLTSLQADPNWKAGTETGVSKSVFFVRDPANPVTVSVDDDDNQTSMRVHTATAESVEDLAKTAPHGTLVRITGSDAGAEDDFYLRFNSAITDVVGDGFGTEGVWEEWVNPNEPTGFDLSTMPHLIEKTGATEFTIRHGDWQPRKVGDAETNPFPDFVGHSIRDIGGFQSRLVFVAGPWCAMSRSNKPTEFFKESALTELGTDPISMSSTEEGTVRFDWIITFDRDLVIMSDPGEGQFIVTGSTKLTPENAAIVKTTAFEMKGGAKPIETGRTIMFPFKSGIYSGINEFFTNDEVTTNGVDTLTETADKYVEGLVDRMKGSTNFNMVVFATDAPALRDTVWVYKYLWKNTEKVQSSWSKWKFPAEVRHFLFTGSEMLLVLADDGVAANTTDYVFCSVDLDIPVDEVAGYHICLDRQVRRNTGPGSTTTLAFSNAAFVQSTGCATPGRPVFPISETLVSGRYEYAFNTDTVPVGAEIVCGARVTRSLKPTMPFVRDRNGAVVPRTSLTVGSFLLEYEDTGYIKARMDSRYRSEPIDFVVDWFPLDNDPGSPSGNGLRSGILEIPWGERSDWSELTLISDDVRPTTFIELEWVGEVFKGNRG